MGRRTALIAGLVLVALMAIGLIVLPDHGDPSARPLASGTPGGATTAAPGPACAPTVAESGFSVSGDRLVSYGLIITNPCPVADVGNEFDVAVLDQAGSRVDDPASAVAAVLPVILPGQRLGLAGQALLGSGTAVSLRVRLIANTPVPADSFAGWPAVGAPSVSFAGPDRHGVTTATVSLSWQPADAALCDPWITAIARDGADRIVFGYEQALTAMPARLPLALPAGADRSRIEFFVRQGQRGLGDLADPRTGLPFVACVKQ
jgi:hypothetical protein